ALVAEMPAKLADDEAADPRPTALAVLGVDAVVADHGVGHRHDLTMIRRVGQDLLIPGHARIENDLSIHLSAGAERPTCKYGAVFERELGDVHGAVCFALIVLRPLPVCIHDSIRP